ncbi:unnamed protein product [Prunus brigantina]
MGETQREMAETMMELKSLIAKLSEENERLPQEESAVAGKGKGNPKEHVNRFINALGPHAGDYNLRLREFSKSLTDRAYTWYTTLALGSIYGEDLMDFVRRFWDLALDCYDENDEEALVEICISNIMADYRVYLENIGISQFSRLLEATRKTSILVKLNGQEAWKSEEEERHSGASFGQ